MHPQYPIFLVSKIKQQTLHFVNFFGQHNIVDLLLKYHVSSLILASYKLIMAKIHKWSQIILQISIGSHLIFRSDFNPTKKLTILVLVTEKCLCGTPKLLYKNYVTRNRHVACHIIFL